MLNDVFIHDHIILFELAFTDDLLSLDISGIEAVHHCWSLHLETPSPTSSLHFEFNFYEALLQQIKSQSSIHFTHLHGHRFGSMDEYLIPICVFTLVTNHIVSSAECGHHVSYCTHLCVYLSFKSSAISMWT